MKRRCLLLLAVLVSLSCGDDPVAPSGPTASFQVNPPSGSNDTDFVVDASSSADPKEPLSKLQVRWDWEDDGSWDTDWTLDKTAVNRYPTEANRTIRLEVQNSSGQSDQTTRAVAVRLNVPPETLLGQPAKRLDTGYNIAIQWTGFDVDGEVAGFLVGWDDPNTLQFTTALAKDFTLPPEFASHTFYCAARDAEGRPDATPATIVVTVPHSFLDSAPAIVDALALAYRQRDVALLQALLANDPDRNAEFSFILSEPTEEGDTRWGYETEARIHRRMFQPENTPPGETPVPLDLWLQTVQITLTAQAQFAERTDLYSTDGGADGLLDPTIWHATSALYSTDVFFAMTGETDYQVTGHADLAVIEDLTKEVGDAGKFLLLIWEDLGPPGHLSPMISSPLSRTTWSGMKAVYR